MTVAEFLDEFVPALAAVESWLVVRRWLDGVRCAHCDAAHIDTHESSRPQPFWCLDCGHNFSVKTCAVMHRSLLYC